MPLAVGAKIDPGYLVYAQEASLVARAFDPDQERFTGEPIPIAEPVERSGSTFKAGFSASRNGTFVYQPSSDTDHLAWIDRSGAEVGTISAPGLYQTLQLSPDGSRLVTDRIDPRTGAHDLWVIDLVRGTEDRVTSGPTSEAFPVWSEEGQSIVFMAARSGAPNLFRLDLRTGREHELTRSARFNSRPISRRMGERWRSCSAPRAGDSTS